MNQPRPSNAPAFRLRKRKMSGTSANLGWLVEDVETGRTVGWVVRAGKNWLAYVASGQDGASRRVGWDMPNRGEAVAEVEIRARG